MEKRKTKKIYYCHGHRKQEKRKLKWSAFVFLKRKRNQGDTMACSSYYLLSSSALHHMRCLKQVNVSKITVTTSNPVVLLSFLAN